MTSESSQTSITAPRTTDRAPEGAITRRVLAVAQAWTSAGPRLEYVLLAAALLIMAGFAFAFFYFDVDIEALNSYGYAGLFVISLVSAASIVMPMPGAAAITGAGAVLDPVLGIPVPIMVGLVAGVAEAIGELTGYAAGYGGSPLLRERSFYPRVKAWMERRGILTMFVLSSFPNPAVDIAGLIAGAVKMPLSHFMTGVLPGKIFKNIYLAAGGLAAAEIVRSLVG
jgi:membrane protein YqaA with SNARE-associated domain